MSYDPYGVDPATGYNQQQDPGQMEVQQNAANLASQNQANAVNQAQNSPMSGSLSGAQQYLNLVSKFGQNQQQQGSGSGSGGGGSLTSLLGTLGNLGIIG